MPNNGTFIELTPPSPSLKELQRVLQKMITSGTKGFEELVARLVGQVIGEKVFLAKSGSQRGDGVTVDGALAIQAKRYGSSTSLNLNEIVGEIHDIMNHTPELEIYVLGTTRSAQDTERLRAVECETGVSIIYLDWSDEQTPVLASLCVTHWHLISDLLPSDVQSEGWSTWCRLTATDQDIIGRVGAASEEILHHVKSHRHVAELASRRLRQRTAPDDRRSHGADFNRIDLTSSVRREVEDELWTWWQRQNQGAAVSRGEEGMGKTWATARFAMRVSDEGAAVVLWLESNEWSDARDIDGALSRALRYLVEDKAIPRIVRKAQKTWSKPVLLVLDGVNERDALHAAQLILRDYAERQISGMIKNQLRLLFTSRERDADTLANQHSNLAQIAVGPYSNTELELAFSLLQQNLSLSDLPETLRNGVARIPRYLPTCCRLLPALGSLEHVTVELVLWHDLRMRIQRDHQIKVRLGLQDTQDVEDVLSHLAQNCAASGETTSGLLNEVFNGNYQSIRNDLLELRWLRSARLGNAKSIISPDHLRLAWALYIRQQLKDNESAISDPEAVIQRCLEPLEAEDQRTAALRVCSRMTLLEPEAFGMLPKMKCQALLNVWLLSRNIGEVTQEVEFWFSLDHEFYIQCVENFIRITKNTDIRQKIIAPIARMWVQGGLEADKLRPHLQQWLLTISAPPESWADKQWSPHLDGQEAVIGIHRFPWSPDENSLKICGVAISILSLRADETLLPVLALATATDDYSLRKIDYGDLESQFEPSADRLTWVPNKQLFDLVASLMRWTFGEQYCAQVLQLAKDNPHDDVLQRGLKWLFAFLRQAQVPEDIKLPPRCSYFSESGNNISQILRDDGSLFDAKPDHADIIQWLSYFEELGSMAIRPDLDWIEADKSAVWNVPISQWDNPYVDGLNIAFSWIARWDQEKTSKLIAAAQKDFSYSKDRPFPSAPACHTLPHPSKREEVLNSLRKQLALIVNEDQAIHFIWAGRLIASLLEESEWLSWIEWIEQHPWVGRIFFFLPIPEILHWRIPMVIVLSIHQKMLRMGIDIGTDGNPAGSHFGFLALLVRYHKIPSHRLFDKLKSWLQQNDPGSYRHSLFELLLSVAPNSESILSDLGDLAYHPDLRNVIHSWWANDLRNHQFFSKESEYHELKRFLPWDVLGEHLMRHQRWQDFRTWGIDLLTTANRAAQSPHCRPPPPGRITSGLNGDGRISTVGPYRETRTTVRFVTASTAWLVDESTNFNGDLENLSESRRAGKIARAHAWDEWFSSTDKAAGNQGRMWLRFSGQKEFIQWAVRHPDDFKEHAIPLFSLSSPFAMYNPLFSDDLFHSVGRAVVLAWYALDPQAAASFEAHSPFRWDSTTSYGLSEKEVISWKPEYSTDHQHIQRRKQSLLDAMNDIQIARLAIAAQDNGSSSILMKLARLWAESSHMKERALAASIFAWIEDSDAHVVLKRLKDGDSSMWVREHASWCLEVWQTEHAARELFVHAGQLKDHYQVSVKMLQLQPALSLAARWWMARELNLLLKRTTIDNAVKAQLYCAWYAMANRRCDERACGRVLQDHWRGEKLSSNRAIFPFWTPSS